MDLAAQLAEPDQDVGEEAADPASPVGSPGPSSPGKGAHGLVLTLNRIKTFIKENAEVKSISTEACFMVARATELLLEVMAERASQKMLQEQRQELDYSDLASTVASWGPLDFLQDIVPKKVPAALVLEKMK